MEQLWLRRYLRRVGRIYTVIQKTAANTLSYSTVISQRFLPKVYEMFEEVMNSNLIRMPPADGVFTLLCDLDVKITLLRTGHVTQLKC